MKVLLLACLLLLLFYGCRFAANLDHAVTNIPGTYFRFSKHVFGTEFDTLTISELNRKAKQFKIIRRWKYERVIEGELTEPEYKVTITTGFYQSKDNLLRENETGSVYLFDADMQRLFNGPITYRKL